MDIGNDDLNVGISFDTDIRPIVSAMAQIKAALKGLEAALPRGQIEKALADPIVSAVRTIETQVGGMREKFRKAQGEMVDDARKAGKGMSAAYASGMEEGARTVKRQLAQLQGEYEQAVEKGWKVNLATLQKMREEGVRLFAQDRRRLIDANAERRIETEATRVGDRARKALDKAFISSASAIDPRTLLGLQSDKLVSSAKAAAAVFSEAFRLDEKGERKGGVDARAMLGLSDALVAKAAKDSAAVFEREFRLDEKGVRASGVNTRTLLGLGDAALVKAAKDSADVFQREFKLDADGRRTGGVDSRTLLGLSDSSISKAAKDSAAVFQREFKLDEGGTRVGAVDARALLGLSEASVGRAAKDSAAVFAREFRLDDLGARGNRVDVRTLLGLDTNAVTKAAKESAAVFAREFRMDEKGLRGGANVDPRALLGLPSATEMSAFTESLKSQLTAQTALTDGKKSLTREAKAAGDAQKELDKALRKSTGAMQDAHSAARGLASGFGAMWLTWGNIAPLLAGAAVSYGLVEAVKAGVKFESTLTTIAALAETASGDVQRISKSALELGAASQYGPLQIADGLKTLSLAGESATDAINGIGAAVQFATVAELPLEQATEYLLAITKSFGYTTAEMNKVSDVVAKVAAETMSSVTDMANAFKVSSTVAQQFGATLEDQSVALGILSQIGIKGREAGTAVRNMYTELLGTSKEARRVLKDTLKLDLFDGDQLKPLKTIMVDITKVIDEYDKKGQLSILNRIFNERGMKSASAYLKALEAEAARAGVSVAELAKRTNDLEEALQNASGFSAVAAASMSATTENIMKSVGSSLEAAMIQVFDTLSPYLVKISLSLRDAFRSEEFVDAVSSMVRSVGELGKFFYENLDIIKALAAGYVTYKLVTIGLIAPVSALATWTKTSSAALVLKQAALTGTGAAGGIAATGITAASAATTWLATASRSLLLALGPISIALTLAATAYTLFGDSAKSAADKAIAADEERARRSKEASEADRMRLDVSIEAMDKEIERIEAFLRHSGDEKKAQEDIAQAAIDSTRSRILAEAQVQAQLKESAAAELEVAAAHERRFSIGSGGLSAYEIQLQNQAADLRKEAADVLSSAQAQLDRYNGSVAKLKELRRQENEEREKNRPKGIRPGDRTFDEDSTASRRGRRPIVATLKTDLGNELALIKQRYTDEISTIQQFERNEQELLKLRHQNKLITDGEFYARELELAQKSEADRLKVIEESRSEYIKKQVEQAAQLQADYATVLKDIDSKLKGDEAVKAREAAATSLQQALVKLGDEGRTFYMALANDEKTIKDNVLTRIEKQAITAAGAIKAVHEASKEFWREQAEANKELDRRDALEDQTRYASEGQVAYLNAAAEARERYTAELRKQQRAVDDVEKTLNTYIEAVGADTVMNDEQARALAQYVDLLIAAKAARDKLAGSLDDVADEAGTRVLRRYQKDEVRRLTADTADAIIIGLTRGGKEGSRALRDIIKRELMKPVTLVVQAMIQPIVGALMGSLGMGSVAGAAAGGGAGSILGGIGSAISMGTSAFGIGAGYGATSLFANGLGATLSAGSSMIGAGSIMSGLGTIVGALGPIALGIGALYTIWKKLDDSGTYHTGGAAQYSSASGLRSGQSGADYRIGFGRVEEGKDTITAVGNLAKGIGSALDAVAVSFGKKAGFEIATAFADDTSKDGAWGALRISKDGKDLLNWEDTRQSRWAPKEFANGEEGYKQYLAAVAKDTRQVLLDMDLPSWADEMLNALGEDVSMDQLTSVIQQISTVQTAFVSLGKVIEGFAGMTDEAFQAIMRASGGIEALSQNAATYYNNFYTPEERKAKAQKELDDKFTELGIAKPKDRDGFRKLVDDALAEADAQAKNRKTLVGGASGAISAAGKDGFTIDDLRKTSLAAGIDPALLGGGGDPATAEKLNKFLKSVSELSAKDLKPEDFQASLEGIVAANSEVLGLGKDAGKTAAALLGLAGSFAELNESAEEAEERIRKERADAREKAYRALERAVAKEKEAIQLRMDAANEIVSTVQGLFDLLKSNVRDLYEEVDSTRRMQEVEGRAFIAQALSAALLTGYLPEQEQLSDAIAGARGGLVSENYSTQFELDRARLVLAGQLSQLEEISGKQLTDAQRTLRELELQTRQLDDTLEYWREQIDIANGTFEATVSVEEAIRDLIDLTKPPETNLKAPEKIPAGGGGGGPTWGPSGGGTNPNVSQKYVRPGSYSGGVFYTGVSLDEEKRLDGFAGLYNSFNGTGDLAGLLTAMKEAGATISDLEALSGYFARDWRAAAESVGIPAFAVGTNYVPRDMLAQIHEGEAIVPKAYNPWAGGAASGGFASNERVEALLATLVEQNVRLEIRLAAIEGHTQDTSKATNGNPVSPMPTVLFEDLT